MLPFLEGQPTSDENKSDKKARKIDGQSIVDKLSFVSKFLPDNTFDTSLLEDIKNDKNIEYYKLKDFLIAVQSSTTQKSDHHTVRRGK
ncbi:hypothetical protein EJ377_14105 [Chryseobacterium arthrosphaerae]|uniref:Uncharacterized protein n=1 Tax=Chryseobacterium arthrosphaerae TaxID=651561 RepID=A0A3S0QF49_9FLAO|nr:hypothetical protein EJ377_14105 [Chryseobacterium arthrosphaerae]